MAKRSSPPGLKWHGGGLIILLPHPASGCDMAIISGPRINSVTKERSPAPARPERGDSGDYSAGGSQKRLLPATKFKRFKVNSLPNWEGTSHDNTGPDH